MYFTDWLVGKEMYPQLFSSLWSGVLPVACSSYAMYGSIRNIFHRHKYHPLGPLKVKIISFLMWTPLWKKLLEMGDSVCAPSARLGWTLAATPNADAPPLRALTFRSLSVGARVHVWAIAQRKWFRTLQAKKRREKSISITIRCKSSHQDCELKVFPLGPSLLYWEFYGKQTLYPNPNMHRGLKAAGP